MNWPRGGIRRDIKKMNAHIVSTTTQRNYYRKDQIREEIRMRKGRKHGIVRNWHKNGKLASEENYENDLLHGLCRQWNEKGRLLGSYEMVHGTGIQRVWFDDGRLQLEQSFVNGLATGRWRLWLRDGSLASEDWLIENREVSQAEYLKAAADHPDWPKYLPDRTERDVSLAASKGTQHAFRLHCDWLLAKSNTREAPGWLEEGSAARRYVGRLTSKQAHALSTQVLNAGGRRVMAADIHRSGKEREFSDVLLVELPKSRSQRAAIRNVFASLPPRVHCAVQPDKDVGEAWLYVYFG